MQHVLVLSSDKKPLDPCHPARARQLLRAGKAAIYRHYPFIIILKNRLAAERATHPHRLKLDPGSKTTGLAVVNEQRQVVWAAELTHKSEQVAKRMKDRYVQRHSRRNRHGRHRAARSNRHQLQGQLTPCMRSRVGNIETWVNRLRRYCPITSLAEENVKFDIQKIQNPEIAGVEYQQGELQGYEVREYLLEKWGRQCAYCGAKNVSLEIEHIIPRSQHGTETPQA